MVNRRSRRWVPWPFTKSLFFNVTLYTLILFWSSTLKPNTNFNNIFYTSFRFDKLLSEIDTVLQKKDSLTLSCQHNTLKEFNFPYIHATSPKTLFNNVTQWLTTFVIDFKHFSPLCLRIWKRSYLNRFNLTLFLSCILKSLWLFFPTF